MKLAFVAFDRSGRQVVDTVEASTVAEANDTLRRRGLFVTKLTGGGSAPAEGAAGRARGRGRSGRLRDLTMFTRQLHVLVASGTPLVQALAALERQAKPGHWRDAVADVRRSVEEGQSLSAAMEAHPGCFDPICRSLVAAGESSGRLADMLDRLAIMTRKRLHVRSAVIGAIIYPSLLLVVAGAVLALLLLFVVPRFGELFRTLEVPLPAPTQALIWAGQTVRSYWWAGLLGLFGGGMAIRLWLSQPAGRKAMDTLVLRLPQAGRIIRSFAIARIARLLGVLLDGRVPVLDALDLTLQSVRNCHYVALMARAREAVTRGEAISSVLRDTDLVSPSVYEAIHSGEQSGQVGPLLLNIADFLDEENEIVLRSLTSVLEPVILILMGLLVGAVAMSLFLPLFDLTAATQGGPR